MSAVEYQAGRSAIRRSASGITSATGLLATDVALVALAVACVAEAPTKPGEDFRAFLAEDWTYWMNAAPDAATAARRIMLDDPRFFTTYYAIDAVNFTPANLASARERIEAAHLPLVVQEVAGLPLDASFAEQKRILLRCDGLFYRCKGGAEARRLNRLLIDAGLITGL